MSGFAPVFDANFYRSTSNEELDDLIELESRANVRPLASFLTCSELFGHVADPANDAHRACRAAVARLYRHCSHDPAQAGPIAIVADPNGLIAQTFFGLTHPTARSLATSFGTLIARVSGAHHSDSLVDIGTELAAIRRHRDDAEARFIASLASIRRQFGQDPQAASDFGPHQRPTPEEYIGSGAAHLAAASALVLNAATEHGISLTERQLEVLGEQLIQGARGAVELFVDRIRKVLLEHANPAKQGNYLWDILLALTAAAQLTEDGAEVWVVTYDQALLRAAAYFGDRSRILSPPEYRRRLKRA